MTLFESFYHLVIWKQLSSCYRLECFFFISVCAHISFMELKIYWIPGFCWYLKSTTVFYFLNFLHTGWSAHCVPWAFCFFSWDFCYQQPKGERGTVDLKVLSLLLSRISPMIQSKCRHSSSQAPGIESEERAPRCLLRRCWSPVRRHCTSLSASTWNGIGVKPSPSNKLSTRKAATVVPLSTGSAMASAIPSTSPGMSGKKKAPSSLAPSASPRNSPPWLLHSIAPSFSPQERRKESPELRSAGVYLLTWTKLRNCSNCTLDCTQSLPAREWVAWTSLPSRLGKTERDLVNYLNQAKLPPNKEKNHVRKGHACVYVQGRKWIWTSKCMNVHYKKKKKRKRNMGMRH